MQRVSFLSNCLLMIFFADGCVVESSDYALASWVYEDWFIKTRQECNKWCESAEMGITVKLKRSKLDQEKHKCGGWIFDSKLRKCTLKRYIAKRKKHFVDGVEYFKKGDKPPIDGEDSECLVGKFLSDCQVISRI